MRRPCLTAPRPLQGHLLLEKRKPALLDSLVQAFALAPLFVWLELLFWCGYRPQLRRELQREVSALLAKARPPALPSPHSRCVAGATPTNTWADRFVA
jgi:hypothetical protein